MIKLIEVTHGQWLYRNVHVHDKVAGVHATRRKEELRKEIIDQLHIGEERLGEEDKYLLEINLDNLESTSEEMQEYWLLAIKAAREAIHLQPRAEQTRNATTQPRMRREHKT